MIRSLFLSLFLGGMATLAQSPAPMLIPFQGRITDQNGTPRENGSYTLIFNLYDQAVGGNNLWTERHEKVGILNGMVNVFLGSIQPLDSPGASVDFSSTRYLGITVDADGNANTADPEMVPRQMIIPAFWAKSADNSSKLAGRDWSDLLVSGNDPRQGKILGAKIENAGITAAQIAPGSVNSTHIADRSITGIDIADETIGSRQIAADAILNQHLTTGSVSNNKIASEALTQEKRAPAHPSQSAPVGGIAVGTENDDTVVLNVTGKRPVWVGLNSANPTEVSTLTAYNDKPVMYFGGMIVTFLVDGVIVAKLGAKIASPSLSQSPSSFWTIVPSMPAGARSISVTFTPDTDMNVFQRVNARLVAFEL